MSKKRILCIEDEPEMVELIRLILGRQGFEVLGAYSGHQALKLLENEAVDLILLDLMMPEMDGWEVFRRLRSQDHTAKIPVIVVTARSQNIDRVLGLHIAKVDEYLTKPFTPRELLNAVNQVLSRQDTAAED